MSDLISRRGAVENVPDASDGWISVKDRLPEKGKRVLVYCAYDPYITIASFYGTEAPSSLGTGFVFEEVPLGHVSHFYHDVSYWQPLPVPPSD